MNTRITLEPLPCPRCGRPLATMANGGSLFLRCESEPPKCGIIIPETTALAWHVEKRNEDRQPLAVVKDTAVRTVEG